MRMTTQEMRKTDGPRTSVSPASSQANLEVTDLLALLHVGEICRVATAITLKKVSTQPKFRS